MKKKVVLTTWIFALVLFGVGVLMSCSSPHAIWKSTKYSDNVEKYRQFVDGHPESPFVPSAEERIVTLSHFQEIMRIATDSVRPEAWSARDMVTHLTVLDSNTANLGNITEICVRKAAAYDLLALACIPQAKYQEARFFKELSLFMYDSAIAHLGTMRNVYRAQRERLKEDNDTGDADLDLDAVNAMLIRMREAMHEANKKRKEVRRLALGVYRSHRSVLKMLRDVQVTQQLLSLIQPVETGADEYDAADGTRGVMELTGDDRDSELSSYLRERLGVRSPPFSESLLLGGVLSLHRSGNGVPLVFMYDADSTCIEVIEEAMGSEPVDYAVINSLLAIGPRIKNRLWMHIKEYLDGPGMSHDTGDAHTLRNRAVHAFVSLACMEQREEDLLRFRSLRIPRNEWQLGIAACFYQERMNLDGEYSPLYRVISRYRNERPANRMIALSLLRHNDNPLPENSVNLHKGIKEILLRGEPADQISLCEILGNNESYLHAHLRDVLSLLGHESSYVVDAARELLSRHNAGIRDTLHAIFTSYDPEIRTECAKILFQDTTATTRDQLNAYVRHLRECREEDATFYRGHAERVTKEEFERIEADIRMRGGTVNYRRKSEILNTIAENMMQGRYGQILLAFGRTRSTDRIEEIIKYLGNDDLCMHAALSLIMMSSDEVRTKAKKKITASMMLPGMMRKTLAFVLAHYGEEKYRDYVRGRIEAGDDEILTLVSHTYPVYAEGALRRHLRAQVIELLVHVETDDVYARGITEVTELDRIMKGVSTIHDLVTTLTRISLKQQHSAI